MHRQAQFKGLTLLWIRVEKLSENASAHVRLSFSSTHMVSVEDAGSTTHQFSRRGRWRFAKRCAVARQTLQRIVRPPASVTSERYYPASAVRAFGAQRRPINAVALDRAPSAHCSSDMPDVAMAELELKFVPHYTTDAEGIRSFPTAEASAGAATARHHRGHATAEKKPPARSNSPLVDPTGLDDQPRSCRYFVKRRKSSTKALMNWIAYSTFPKLEIVCDCSCHLIHVRIRNFSAPMVDQQPAYGGYCLNTLTRGVGQRRLLADRSGNRYRQLAIIASPGTVAA